MSNSEEKKSIFIPTPEGVSKEEAVEQMKEAIESAKKKNYTSKTKTVYANPDGVVTKDYYKKLLVNFETMEDYEDFVAKTGFSTHKKVERIFFDGSCPSVDSLFSAPAQETE